MHNKLYSLQGEKIMHINGKYYVSLSDKETLINTSQTFTPLFFVRTRKNKWFPDSPAIGCEQWAFRESQMHGPFSRKEEAEQAQQELEVDLKKSEGDYTVSTQLFARALPEEYAADIQIQRYWRHSLRMTGDSADRPSLENFFQTASSKFKASKEYVDKDDRLIGIVDGIFYCLYRRRCPEDYRDGQYSGPFSSILAFDSFGSENEETLWNMLDADPQIYREKAFQWTCDLHESSEAFITFEAVDISVECDPLENFLRRGNFMPSTLEKRFGKHLLFNEVL